MKKLLVVLALLTVSTVSSAEGFIAYVSGNKLFSWLEKEDGVYEVTVSLGYIQGVADALATQGFLCLPKNVTPNQLNAMAKNHLENDPSIRHYAAADQIGTLFMTTFPCNDSPK